MPASVARVPAPGAGGSPRGFPTAGAVAVAAGVAQRMADGSVVFGAPNPAAGGAPSFTGTSAPLTGAPRLPTGISRPVVQRAAEVAEEPPPPEPEPEPEPVTEPDPVAETEAETQPGPGGDSVTDAAAAARSAGGPAAPPVTDELVRALYAPLSRLLRNDLRLERERAGRLINTRH
ncbi:hypothetical protein AN221_09870 [Streptomyces nanshensis]|uniref:Uncharacterized protein n=1 Tax=Streptomyces nanshensis TaxID=518642 RepID=A0A1E7LWQ6_9ACTN|nr:hypothetical protein AN221_09870 [Streptomyces nanshensis]